MEIGPGLGALTELILEKGARVLAIEKDTRLANFLRERLHHPRLEVLNADALDFEVHTLFSKPRVNGREAARRMIARGRGGKIINVGSLTSEVARATVAPYAAAKGGVKMLTRSMTAEWAPHGIQANAIGPGYIVTEMTGPLAADPKFDAWLRGRTPSGRWGRPEDLTGVAVFLASDASNYVNGQIIYVDGGLLAVM